LAAGTAAGFCSFASVSPPAISIVSLRLSHISQLPISHSLVLQYRTVDVVGMPSQAGPSSGPTRFASKMKMKLPGLRRSRATLFPGSGGSSTSVKTSSSSSEGRETYLTVPGDESCASLFAALRSPPECPPRPAPEVYASCGSRTIVRTLLSELNRMCG
jgi:hypothetical protein